MGMELLAGLAWAVEEGFDVINLSLATTRRRFVEALYETGRRRLLRRDDDRRLRQQHAGPELSVEVLLGRLRRQPRGRRPDPVLLEPRAAG